MNIKYALLATLMGASVVTTAIANQTTSVQNHSNEQQGKNWFASYAAPCITGGMAGFLSGKMSAYMIKNAMKIIGIVDLLSLLRRHNIHHISVSTTLMSAAAIGALVVEHKLRTKCVKALNQSFENHGIEHHNLTSESAQIVAALSFLKTIL